MTIVEPDAADGREAVASAEPAAMSRHPSHH